jgi:hypothetical protein
MFITDEEETTRKNLASATAPCDTPGAMSIETNDRIEDFDEGE